MTQDEKDAKTAQMIATTWAQAWNGHQPSSALDVPEMIRRKMEFIRAQEASDRLYEESKASDLRPKSKPKMNCLLLLCN